MTTIYIKVLDDSGNAASVEELTNPVYVYKQPSNGLIVRCIDTLAQGVRMQRARRSTSWKARRPSTGHLPPL